MVSEHAAEADDEERQTPPAELALIPMKRTERRAESDATTTVQAVCGHSTAK